MSAIAYLSKWVTYLSLLVGAGAGAMIGYFALQKAIAIDDQAIGHYTVRIKQTLKGAIVATSIAGFITVVKKFYG